MRFSIIFTGQTSNDSTGNSKLPASVCKYCRSLIICNAQSLVTRAYMLCLCDDDCSIVQMWFIQSSLSWLLPLAFSFAQTWTPWQLMAQWSNLLQDLVSIQAGAILACLPTLYSICFCLFTFFTFYLIVNDEEGEEKAGLGNVMSRTCLYEHAIPNDVFYVIFLVSGFSLV